MKSAKLLIRRGQLDDASIIEEFNARMARETENITLDPAVLRKGVRAALEDSSRALYFVADLDGQVVGQLMITFEWSDWRNGNIWWIQSVYVRPESRRRGVFQSLYRHVSEEARSQGGVGLRLYVEKTNSIAQATYQRLGMHASHYLLLEEMFKQQS